MEVLAGDNDTVVTVKHSKCEFQFDFAHVYWNPRLGTEHERIHGLLKKGDVLYDVFAGVGPFAVPAGKQKVQVLANDLNPKSFEWLQFNIKKNKVSEYVKAYNLDGREFICKIVQQDLAGRVEAGQTNNPFHVVMNLPAIAVEFLDAFWNLLPGKEIGGLKIHVHVYCFIKGAEDYKHEALELVKDQLGFQLGNSHVDEVAFVRNVAPNKEMLRVSFQIPEVVLTSPKPLSETGTGSARKRKLSEITEDD
jgi:tRNA (guanine37-N1)-methyltransferase